MLDRATLVVQMAKAFKGESLFDPKPPSDEAQQRAREALARVELFLGADVDEARDVLRRVMEDVS